MYKVQNIFDQHMYAMKVIDLYEYDPMLIREARNMSRLSHDNVVRYYSSWVEKADEELGLDNLDTLEEESGNTTKHESKEEYIDDDDDSGSNNSGTTQENSDDSTQHNINDDLDIEFSFESETEEANSSDTDKASTEDSDDSGDWTNSSEKHSVGKNKSILIGHPKENPLETGKSDRWHWFALIANVFPSCDSFRGGLLCAISIVGVEVNLSFERRI